MDFNYVNQLVSTFGLPAIFFLTMAEGDITLLLAGVLAHGQSFGEYSFGLVLLIGTLGGVVSDNVAYCLGRGTRSKVSDYRFYRAAEPRLRRLTKTFGPLSISHPSSLSPYGPRFLQPVGRALRAVGH